VSYDVHLLRFRAGEAVPIESPQVWELLEQAWDAPPDEFEYCRVRRGADEGDVYGLKPGKALEGLMFNHAGPAIYELMYEVAAAGDMAIVPPDAGPFLVRDDQRAHLPPELADEAKVVGSGAELLQEIQGS
jgi:hypothetical protein